jgi:SPP1 gp7 family putative phage head morphogenesis protein
MMLRYSIAKLGRQAGRKAGTSASLPAIEARLSTEREYYSTLRNMLAKIAQETRQSIIPAYEAEQRQTRAERLYTADAGRAWFVRLRQLAKELSEIAPGTVERILNLESKRHTDTFMATAKKALGIDLRAVVQQEDLADYLQEAAARNASLITGLSDDLLKGIEQAVYTNSIAGNSVTTLRKSLQEQFGIADRRAKLLARDQTGKLNSDLNRRRQEQAGVTSYAWLSSRDERVRERHRRLEGEVYKWGEATGAEQGLPPGQPINCRCLARGIVEF